MRASVLSLLIGTVFGVGLAVSEMMNPAKVIGFLDFAGDWDPTLAFVMAAALAVATLGFAMVRQRQQPYLGGTFQIPSRKEVDTRLIGGAVVFGIGWGVAGFCPGPAIAALATGQWPVFVFVAAMLAGMWLHRLLGRR